MLRHLPTGRIARLRARTTIGRSPACMVRLRGRLASGEHASITWNGVGWTLRDLGSRNGTWIDDRRLVPGEATTLELGQVLAFGDPGDQWQMAAIGPPSVFAEPMTGAVPVDAHGGVIALPSSVDPQVMVFRTADGWIVEDDAGVRAIHDQAVVVAGGSAWRLALPEVLESTLSAGQSGGGPVAGPRLRLRFSRDEEFAQAWVERDGEWVEVPSRASHMMLVVLARERAADAAASRAERGWMHVELLADALGIGPRTVNVHVCRLRQQFGELGIEGLVERRPGTGLIRIGVDQIDLGPL